MGAVTSEPGLLPEGRLVERLSRVVIWDILNGGQYRTTQLGGRGQWVSQLFWGIFTRDSQGKLKKNII